MNKFCCIINIKPVNLICLELVVIQIHASQMNTKSWSTCNCIKF